MNNELSTEIIENRTIYPIIETEVKSMIITATEFKKNLGKYLELVANEDITITKNGKPIAILARPFDKAELWDTLVGCAGSNSEEEIDVNSIRDERLKRQ